MLGACPVAQADRRSPPSAGGPGFASRSPHVGFVVDEMEPGRFFSAFSRFTLPKVPFHHFSTLISFILIYLISSSCDGASGVVERHPCYSLTFNIGASKRLIPRPCLVSETS